MFFFYIVWYEISDSPNGSHVSFKFIINFRFFFVLHFIKMNRNEDDDGIYYSQCRRDNIIRIQKSSWRKTTHTTPWRISCPNKHMPAPWFIFQIIPHESKCIYLFEMKHQIAKSIVEFIFIFVWKLNRHLTFVDWLEIINV